MDETSAIFGDIFTMQDTVELCRQGVLTDYDGYGEPIAMTPCCEMARIPPTQILRNRNHLLANYRYFVWYNR